MTALHHLACKKKTVTQERNCRFPKSIFMAATKINWAPDRLVQVCALPGVLIAKCCGGGSSCGHTPECFML